MSLLAINSVISDKFYHVKIKKKRTKFIQEDFIGKYGLIYVTFSFMWDKH